MADETYEPITAGQICKAFKNRTNRRYVAGGAGLFEFGSNEHKIKRMGPSRDNRGPAAGSSKSRPYAVMRRAMAARMPLWLKSTKPK